MLITPSVHGTCVNKGNRLLLLSVHYNTHTTTVVIDVCYLCGTISAQQLFTCLSCSCLPCIVQH